MKARATGERAGGWRGVATAATALGAASALVAAVWAGLGRMGAVGSAPGWLVAAHGPLIVNGFFAAVISLERAVALGRPVGFAIPVAATAGTWAAVASWPVAGGAVVLAAGLGLVVLFAAVTYRDPQAHHVVMGLGAVAWTVGVALWFAGAVFPGWSPGTLAPWWASFLILTIAGERLELARVLQIAGWRWYALLAALGLLLAGAAIGTVRFDTGMRLFGFGTAATALWLGAFDVASRTARASGLTAYIGRVLLAGYVWLGVGGGLLMWIGGATAGPRFGAAWHAVLLGFVFSMIFAHAPVVLRALADVRVRFHAALYAAPILLSATLALRIWGNFAVDPTLRHLGGLGNAAAIALFAATVVARLER